MITIVLDNLISNAVKYTDKGVITLSLYNVVRDGLAQTEIKVSDTGYGISAEALHTSSIVIIRKEADTRLRDRYRHSIGKESGFAA